MENVKSYSELLAESKKQAMEAEGKRLSILFDSEVNIKSGDTFYHPEFNKNGFDFRGIQEVSNIGITFGYKFNEPNYGTSFCNINCSFDEKELAILLTSEDGKELLKILKETLLRINEITRG